ncbi:MAG TPA: hypothetical protein VF503_12055 [Sphingobium sp.]|uniref:EF-hand domain-containing protein n=1 Tax=Sphingobium sp. TaxID=1912891 RepID=UPI002ED4FB40
MKILIAATVAFAAPAAAFAQDAATKNYIDGAFAVMDTNKDGQVNRAEFEVFMQARLARQAQAFDAGFAAIDKNSDGGINKTEAAANPALLENFAQVDANADGRISKEELRNAMLAAQAAEAGAQ